MRRPIALAAGAFALMARVAGGADELGDPWRVIEAFRAGAASEGARAGDFEQTYVPQGFSTGETERGTISLALPDCLRWDYRSEPARSFLVCGDQVHSWVAGEPRGHRETIDADQQPGLDLLLLPVYVLRLRYGARLERAATGEYVIALAPADRGSRLTGAQLTISAGLDRLVAMSTRDVDGNETRYRFAAFAPTSDPERFTPPADLSWSER